MTKTLSRFSAAMIGAIAILVVLACLVSAPVEGYYRAPIFKFLDGSAGYLHFCNGRIDVVNIGGTGGDSRCPLGVYNGMGRSEVVVSFIDRSIRQNSFNTGWFGFDWSVDMAQGFPDGNHCTREFRPWRLKKLSQVRSEAAAR